MELFKEISVFGLNFLKAKKGIKMSKKEIEQAEKIINYLGRTVNQTADFVNDKNLVEPITNGTIKVFKRLLAACIFIICITSLFLFFSDNLFANLASFLIIFIICRILLILAAVCAVILLIVAYAVIKSN